MLNLPHRTQVASGRIIEGMAAGKPVLSPFLHNEMDNRFIDRKKILYYENETDLIELIKELQNNLDFGNYIAEEARRNVLENYTTEVLVKRILEFTK
jgi:spore maturation protein CgeB